MNKIIIPLFIGVGLILFFMTGLKLFVSNILSGRVHFPEEYIGSALKMEDGKIFTVLRRLRVEGKDDNTKDYTVFRVRFKFKTLGLDTNKRLSMIPAPFLMGMKGFREKFWTFNEKTDYFQGIYQWQSKEIAEKYPDSFIYKLMTKRSAPGTLSYVILPNTDLSDYIKRVSVK